MNELFYFFLVPTMLTVGGWYKDEIKLYFKTFTPRKNWFEIVMFIIALLIVTMSITIVKYAP